MRRVLWNAFAIPITGLILAAIISDVTRKPNVLDVLSDAMAIPWLAAMHLHIWGKQLGNRWMWRVFAVALTVWFPLDAFLLEPTARSGVRLNLALFALCAPIFVAMWRYAFRRWNDEGSVQHAHPEDCGAREVDSG